MNTQKAVGVSIRNGLLVFYEHNRRSMRIAGHLLMWLVVYFALIDSTSSRVFQDNDHVINTASIVDFIETVVLYYFIGYYILPKFFYQRDFVKLTLLLLALFFVVYQVNFYLFGYLGSISNQTRPDGQVTYARKIATMLEEAGWLGCFTTLRVSLWNFSYGFLLPLLILVFKVFRDVISYQRRLVIAERDKFALELDFLKAQVNPHFLFNTLNSVYARIFDTDEQAANLVLQLSELMRYNLYETDQPKIALGKELAYIQNYLDLERNRLIGQNIVIDYQQTGDPTAYQIAPLLLIAFVENAFKHGVKGIIEPAYVQVTAEVKNGELVFIVENSIPPKRPNRESVPKTGGVGLVNVRRRLDALYAGRYALDVATTANTYTIRLTIGLELLRLETTTAI